MPGPMNHLAVLPQIKNAEAHSKANESQRRAQLEKACRDFESLFVNYMMKQMRETVPKEELFGNSQAEKIYNSMLDQEVAETISEQRGLGLADLMFHQMAAINDNKTTKK